MFKPATDQGHRRSCLWNGGVPKGQDYLAITITEIEAIFKKNGVDKVRTPWKVIDNIYWHSPDKTFERCGCLNSPPFKHDRVQVFLPATFPKFWGRGLKSPGKLATGGAVIFGHSWKFPLRWGALGVPEEGNPVTSIEDDSIFYDSGLGSSQSPSSMDRQGRSPDSFQPSQSANGYLSPDPRLYKLPNQQFMHQDATERTGVTPELAAMQLPDPIDEPGPSRRRVSRARTKHSKSPDDAYIRGHRSVRDYDALKDEESDDILMSNEPVIKRRKHETQFEDLAGHDQPSSRKGKEKALF